MLALKVPWGGYAYPAYHLNPAFYQCDVYASMAKLKNHWIAGVTMTMKNMEGKMEGPEYKIVFTIKKLTDKVLVIEDEKREAAELAAGSPDAGKGKGRTPP